jgi:NO-binding membrane sensor protein with MHYT domain
MDDATVDGFSHGLLPLLAALAAACLGGAVGLRCLVRGCDAQGRRRTLWLALSSVSLACAVWVAHCLAMMGFTVAHAAVGYDPLTVFASLGVAVLMIGTGVFIVGHRGSTGYGLFTGGTLAGLGVASLHYLGMAGIRIDGRVNYNTLVVAASVVTPVVAATAALWAAGRRRGRLWTAGGSAAVGAACLGMHYVGMAAMRVRLYGTAVATPSDSPVKVLAVLLICPAVLLVLAAAVVLVAPLAAGRHPAPEAVAARRVAALPVQRTRTGPPARSGTPQR